MIRKLLLALIVIVVIGAIAGGLLVYQLRQRLQVQRRAGADRVAQMELARDSVTGWQGTITFKVDPREGSRHLMREGQNIPDDHVTPENIVLTACRQVGYEPETEL